MGAVMRPEAIMKSIIPVVMAGIIAIYGVVVAVLIAGQLAPAGVGSDYTLYKGFVHLGAGLSVGLSGLAAGYAIGIVGDAGVRGTAQQPRLFVGMILILISPRCWVSTGSSSPSICTPRNREGSHLQTILPPGHQHLQQPTKYRIMLKCCDDHIDKSRYSKLWQVPIKSDPCIFRKGASMFQHFHGG